MIKRAIAERINNALAKKKAVTIMGPRKVGKSTFADSIIPKDERVFEINGDTQTLLLGYGNPQWSNREYGPRIPQVT